MPKLTKRVVEAAETRDVVYFIWDDDISPASGSKFSPAAANATSSNTAPADVRVVSTSPPTSALPCEQARTRAMAVIDTVKAGDDPAARRDADREAVTVKEPAERFDQEHISVRVKATTAKGYRRLLDKTILPALGRLRVIEVTRADIAKLHHDQRHIPYEANRCLEVVSKMFSLAEMWELAFGRVESAQAYKELPRGEARTLPEPGRA